jgi:single-strand DNA-binding protein
MPSYDRTILLGNLTRDPELRYTPKGTPVANTAIAINRRWRDSESGDLREEVVFIELEVWGKQAETLNKHARCGSGLHVEGHHVMSQWEDKETGRKHTMLRVSVDNFQFVGRPPEEKDEGSPAVSSPSTAPAPAAKKPAAKKPAVKRA